MNADLFSVSQNTQHCDRLNKQSWNTATALPVSPFSCGGNCDRMSASLTACKENILREPKNNWHPQTWDRLQKTDACRWHAAVQLPEQCRTGRIADVAASNLRSRCSLQVWQEVLLRVQEQSWERVPWTSSGSLPGFLGRGGLQRPLHLAGGKAPIAVRRRSPFSLQSCDVAASRLWLFALDLVKLCSDAFRWFSPEHDSIAHDPQELFLS